MSKRLAYRPRYQQPYWAQPSRRFRTDFFSTRWAYRQQASMTQRFPLGQRLLSIPFERFVHGIGRLTL